MASSQTGATKFGIQGSKSFTRQGHEQRRGSRTTLNYHHEAPRQKRGGALPDRLRPEADLGRCLTQRESHGRVDTFPLGAPDASHPLSFVRSSLRIC